MERLAQRTLPLCSAINGLTVLDPAMQGSLNVLALSTWRDTHHLGYLGCVGVGAWGRERDPNASPRAVPKEVAWADEGTTSIAPHDIHRSPSLSIIIFCYPPIPFTPHACGRSS